MKPSIISPTMPARSAQWASAASAGSAASASGGSDIARNEEIDRILAEASITTAITAEERAEFREMFNFVKREGSSSDTRDRSEIKYLMDIVGLNPTEAELSQMMDEVDTDGSGDVDFDEFVNVMSQTTPFHIPSGKLRSALRMFEDEQKEGFCSTELLKEAISYHCADELKDDHELSSLLSKLDPGKSGMIKIDDFMNIIIQSEKAFADIQKQQQQQQQQQQTKAGDDGSATPGSSSHHPGSAFQFPTTSSPVVGGVGSPFSLGAASSAAAFRK